MAKTSKRNVVYICVAILAICFILFVVWYTRLHEPFASEDAVAIMRKSHVVFGCTVRNVDPYLPTLLGHIERCGNRFASWKLIVYENDSTDRTRDILQEFRGKRDNVECIFEDGVAEPLRTKRLSHGRNLILDRIRSLPGPIDYVIVVDPDDMNMSGTFVESIQHCFDPSLEPWDVMTGNQANAEYYDKWALRYAPIIDTDVIADGSNFLNYHFNFPADMPPFQVDSAFGCIAVYRWDAMQRCHYVGEYKEGNVHGYPPGIEKCEHVELNECIRHNGGSIWLHPAFSTN